MIGNLQFFVTGRDGAVLLEAIDQALHAVALPIGGPIEADPTPRLGGAAGNHRPDAAAAQVGAHRAAGVALVADDAVGADAGAAATGACDGPALQQRWRL